MVIGGRNDDVCVICKFYKLVARIHCSEVSCSYYVWRRPNDGALDDACCYFPQCRSLVAIDCAVGMFREKFCQSVVYMCRYVQLSYFVQEGEVLYRIECFTKVQRDDNYILVKGSFSYTSFSNYSIYYLGSYSMHYLQYNGKIGKHMYVIITM